MSAIKRLLTSKKTKKALHAGESSSAEELAQEFQRRKTIWQEEIERMSEFLIIKSTEEQKEEGVEEPVDTAYVVDRDGMPMLKALFDVHSFRPEDVQVSVDDDLLTVKAEGLEDTECSIFRKTLIRRLDLPENADRRRMHSTLTNEGLLSIEMPFHLSPQRKPLPQGRSNIVPILQDDVDGRRFIRLSVPLGTEFTTEDVKVEVRGRRVAVGASYKAEVGEYGSEIAQREIKKEFQLPDYVDIDHVTDELSSDGRLWLEINLKTDATFHCHISTEDIVESTESTGSLNSDE